MDINLCPSAINLNIGFLQVWLTSPKYTAPTHYFQKYAFQKYMQHWQAVQRAGAGGACALHLLCDRLCDGCKPGMPPQGSSNCAARPCDVG